MLCFSAFGFQRRFWKASKTPSSVQCPSLAAPAADNDVTPYEWSMFSSEGGVSQKGVVLVLGRSSVEVACCMASGFKPTERKGVATKVDGYWLLEIDDRPALAMYNEWTNKRKHGRPHDELERHHANQGCIELAADRCAPSTTTTRSSACSTPESRQRGRVAHGGWVAVRPARN